MPSSSKAVPEALKLPVTFIFLSGFVMATTGKSDRGSMYILNAPASPILPAVSSAVTRTLYLPFFFADKSKVSVQLSGFSAVRVSTSFFPAANTKVRSEAYTQTRSRNFFIRGSLLLKDIHLRVIQRCSSSVLLTDASARTS